MKAECPKGHTENLSYEELFQRLRYDDWNCRECSKELSYTVDRRFWNKYIANKRRILQLL